MRVVSDVQVRKRVDGGLSSILRGACAIMVSGELGGPGHRSSMEVAKIEMYIHPQNKFPPLVYINPTTGSWMRRF